MKSEVIETKTAKVWLNEENICCVEHSPNAEIALAEMKENAAAVYNVIGGKISPVLVDIREVKYITREARSYVSSEKALKAALAQAFLIGSPVSRVIGNFFLGINKTPFPTKLFTSKEKALSWLRGFIDKKES
ncbi:MAG: hypothetical protein KAW12_01955 [Candidatus Aminicenantes bacterium]|nr:hypothetical protein [Candidatus Aminicenantes bacterium]